LKRLAFVLALVAALASVPAVGAAPAPKATGGYGYTIGDGVQRHVSFAAIQSTTNTCGVLWNVEGVTSFDFTLNGDPVPGTHYVHHVSLTQVGTTVTGDGGYPVTGPPDAYHWNITSGSNSGNTLALTMTYDVGVPGVVMHMNGTIAANGSISGTWDDNAGAGGATRTGTFTATGATALVSYCGKGTFYYTDSNGIWYFGVVKAVSVGTSGGTPAAWYAVSILAGNAGLNGQWLAVRVLDAGEPGIGVDQTGGDVADGVTVVNDVLSHYTPTITALVNEGNIQVH